MAIIAEWGLRNNSNCKHFIPVFQNFVYLKTADKQILTAILDEKVKG
jgi:hypothetical protein